MLHQAPAKARRKEPVTPVIHRDIAAGTDMGIGRRKLNLVSGPQWPTLWIVSLRDSGHKWVNLQGRQIVRLTR